MLFFFRGSLWLGRGKDIKYLNITVVHTVEYVFKNNKNSFLL
jgi:hypothetical protein